MGGRRFLSVLRRTTLGAFGAWPERTLLSFLHWGCHVQQSISEQSLHLSSRGARFMLSLWSWAAPVMAVVPGATPWLDGLGLVL